MLTSESHPSFPCNIYDTECLRKTFANWVMLACFSLAPAFRAGLINAVEYFIPKCACPGRNAKHKRQIIIDVDGESLLYYAKDDVELDDEHAAQLHERPWSNVRQILGLGRMDMWIRALIRLWLLHLSTPTMFVFVFYAAQSTMGSSELCFAVCVLLRELIYIMLVLSAVFYQPAMLFFDVQANINKDQLGLAITFILSPDLLLAGREVVSENKIVGLAGEVLLRPVLLTFDACALCAIFAAALSGDLYLPTAILYGVTGCSAVWTFISLVIGENEAIDGIRRALTEFIKGTSNIPSGIGRTLCTLCKGINCQEHFGIVAHLFSTCIVVGFIFYLVFSQAH